MLGVLVALLDAGLLVAGSAPFQWLFVISGVGRMVAGFFLPAYFLAGFLAYLRGGHPYWDNPFERDARRAERG